MKSFDTIIIGAGASGLMAAVKHKDKNIALIEANNQIGEKIKISGGGKCNITNQNVSAENYVGDEIFVKTVLNKFSNDDLLAFLNKRGVTPVLRKNSQYFCSKSSNEILEVFKHELKDTPIFYNTQVIDIEKNGLFKIQTNKGVFSAKKVVIASGGLSYQKIGASSIAFKIAEKFGHTISTLKPVLVGFTVQKDQFWFKELSGISIPVKITVNNKSFQDDLLFAHKGISGPAVLNASLYWEKGLIAIDFLPNISLKLILKSSKKQITTVLRLPKRFSKAFLESVDVEDKVIEKLTVEEIEKLKILKNYTFAPAGNFGYTKAEVTKGGINIDEIDVNTMMSKKEKNLYFLGECLDITGELGGYNFQWAFSSAWNLKV